MIQKHIRKMVSVHLFIVIAIAAATGLAMLIGPFQKVFHPEKLEQISDIEAYYDENRYYVALDGYDLHYTGYNRMKNGHLEGAYYYIMEGGTCYFVLLNADDAELESERSGCSITGRLRKNDAALQKMTDYFAGDIEWSKEGLSEIMAPVYLSEPAYQVQTYRYVYDAFIALHILLAVVGIVMLAIAIEPRLHPSMLKIMPYGRLKKQINLANRELESRVTADFGKIKITENYMIDLGKRHMYVMPLRHIIWVFRIGDLQAFTKQFFTIRYNIHIYGRYGVRFISSTMTSETAKQLIQYLKEYSDEILFGYTEENHRLAKKYGKKAGRKK